jgi:hypothetical protein
MRMKIAWARSANLERQSPDARQYGGRERNIVEATKPGGSLIIQSAAVIASSLEKLFINR